MKPLTRLQDIKATPADQLEATPVDQLATGPTTQETTVRKLTHSPDCPSPATFYDARDGWGWIGCANCRATAVRYRRPRDPAVPVLTQAATGPVATATR